MSTTPLPHRGLGLNATLLLVALATLGCASLADGVAQRLAERQLNLGEDLHLIHGELALYRRCFHQRSGTCSGDASAPLPHTSQATAGGTVEPLQVGSSDTLRSWIQTLPPGDPARQAFHALSHPVAQSLVALHNHLRAHPTSPDSPHVRVERRTAPGPPRRLVHLDMRLHELDEFWKLLLGSIGGRGWERLEADCRKLLERADELPPEAKTRLVKDCRTASFVHQYLAAYFRHGQILKARLDVAGDQVQGKLSNVLRVSSTGFVSRDLTFEAKLPSFELTLDPTSSHPLLLTDLETGQVVTDATRWQRLGVSNGASGAAIGGQLVRVFLEAIFDSHEGLPALAPQNAPAATGLDVGEYSLPLFQAPLDHVSAADFNVMTRINGQVSANVKAVLSRVVAGIGPLSLNNPALEELIVEALTTTVRKTAEKATWCWYACNLDQSFRDTVRDVDRFLEAETKRLTARVETPLHRLAHRDRDTRREAHGQPRDPSARRVEVKPATAPHEAHDEPASSHDPAEQVHLRLRIHP